jgi:polysaccharide biosynthesis protein PslG
VGIYRTTMLWSRVEPQRGRREWGPYDDMVERSAQAGMTLLPTLVGSPGFAAKRETFPPRRGAPMRRWLAFVRDAVNRYGRGGKIWREHPSLRYRPVRAWQVWNEPNFPSWWRGHPNARQYTRFLARTRRAIKRADRRAKVVLAGLPETRTGIPMTRFLPALYRAGARRLFDAVAVHPYARDRRGVIRVIRRARSIMRSHGDGRKSVWVTEIGWATAGPVSRNTRRFRTTEAGQAKRIKTTLRALAGARRRLRIGAVVWFSLQDRRPVSGERDWWGLHTGLFRVSGNPKPGWFAFVRRTGGDPGSGSLDPIVPGAPPPTEPPPPTAPPPSGGGDDGGGGGGGGGGSCLLPIICP